MTSQTMKRSIASGAAFLATAAVVVAVFGVTSTLEKPTPEPTPTVASFAVPADLIDDALTAGGEVARVAIEAETARIFAEAEAARVAAEAEAAAQAEADRIAAEAEVSTQTPERTGAVATPSQPAAPAPAPAPEPEPAPAPPISCPAGSMAQSNDGYNDTSCLPEHCMYVVVGDPADPHPECEVAFRP